MHKDDMERKTLPNRRRSWRQKYSVAGVTFFLTCGEYEDGSLGEMFVDIAKAGSVMRSTMDGFAKNFSIALQYGTPLHVLVDAHRCQPCDPSGVVWAEGSQVVHCDGIINCIMQELAYVYIIHEGSEVENIREDHRDRSRGGPDDADPTIREREAGGPPPSDPVI